MVPPRTGNEPQCTLITMSAWVPRGPAVLSPIVAPGSRCPVTAVPPPGEPVHSGGDVMAEAMEFLESYARGAAVAGGGGRVARGTGGDRGDRLVPAHPARSWCYGARVAWRQSARCVGRVRWAGLRVRDRRGVTTVGGYRGGVGAASGGGGQRRADPVGDDGVRAGPAGGGSAGAALERPADPLLRSPDATTGRCWVIRRRWGWADAVRALGWHPPPVPGRFDLLPWVVETAYEIAVVWRCRGSSCGRSP